MFLSSSSCVNCGDAYGTSGPLASSCVTYCSPPVQRRSGGRRSSAAPPIPITNTRFIKYKNPIGSIKEFLDVSLFLSLDLVRDCRVSPEFQCLTRPHIAAREQMRQQGPPVQLRWVFQSDGDGKRPVQLGDTAGRTPSIPGRSPPPAWKRHADVRRKLIHTNCRV